MNNSLLPSSLSEIELLRLSANRLTADLTWRQSRNRLKSYRPYSKQSEFHAAGLTFRERLLMAGNQLGKTMAGSMEVAMHATGIYKPDWPGRRFTKATAGWAAGITGLSTRDTVQQMLLGKVGHLGTGSIPGDLIIDTSPARGVADQIDTVQVKHISGETSLISLKSYEQGREKWQGPSLDWVWFDEEPDLEIYTEGITRTNATGGLVWMTFTPLLGMSEVVKRFLMEKSADRHITQMTIEEAEHYTPEERTRIINSYPLHEREARTKGVPILGSGRVFPVTEESISEKAIEIPDTWARIAALDFGWDHPTAGVWLAHDRDADCVHVTDCYRAREATPVIVAAAVKPRGKWIPIAWPHDGLQHDKGSGKQLAELYREQDLKMLPEHATFGDDRGYGLEAGVIEMLDRMQTGRWKVAEHLADWWEEFRMYHRKDGLIVKLGDDLMSASRVGMMMLRHAKRKPGAAEAAAESVGGWMS